MNPALAIAVIAGAIAHVHGPLTWKPIRWKDGAAHAWKGAVRVALYDRDGRPVCKLDLDRLVEGLATPLRLKRSHVALVAVREAALRVLAGQ